MGAVVQIVDRVGTGGTVLLDLNRHAGGALLGKRDDVALADVQLAQQARDGAFVWSPGATAGAPSELASRQITIPVVLTTATADLTAALVRQVSELVRSRWVLKIQRHGSTVPVWLRCAPTAPRWNTQVAAPGQPTRIVTGNITAETEPYALGARVDVGPVSITQDPSTGTPFVWDINSVGGDSLTPLVIRSADTDLLGTADRTWISVRRRGTPSSLAGLAVQAEGASTATGASPPTLSTVTSDSALSGGSGLRATYGAGASGPWSATIAFPALTGDEAPGLYRLVVRVRRSGAAAGQLFSLVATVGRQRQVETVTAGGNDTRIVDMGLVQVPIGQPPYLSAPESPASAAAPSVTISVVRAAEGDGTFDLDWVGLFPADTDSGVLEVASAVSGVLALDGYDQAPRLYSTDPYTGTTPSATGAPSLSWIGRVPRLRPGSNRLYVVGGLGAVSGVTRAPGLTLDLSASYWPRFGWLG